MKNTGGTIITPPITEPGVYRPLVPGSGRFLNIYRAVPCRAVASLTFRLFNDES